MPIPIIPCIPLIPVQTFPTHSPAPGSASAGRDRRHSGTAFPSGGATMYPQPRVKRSGTLGNDNAKNQLALKGRCKTRGTGTPSFQDSQIPLAILTQHSTSFHAGLRVRRRSATTPCLWDLLPSKFQAAYLGFLLEGQQISKPCLRFYQLASD